MPLDAVTLGEAMAVLIGDPPGPLSEVSTLRRHVGGAELNVAIGLARLGHAAGWLGRLGDDEFGRSISFRLRGEGVDVSHALVDASAPTGLLIRERREVGPIEVLYYRRGSAASRLSPADIDESYIQSARWLHLTGITPALSDSCREATFAAVEIARAAGVPVAFDPNMRFKLWSAAEARPVLLDLIGRSQLVLTGDKEAEMLTGEDDPETAARHLRRLGPELVAVKLGAKGSLAVQGDRLEHSPAVPLPQVVDPVGAGDAFDAGFLAGQLRGFSLADGLALANRCGAHATTVPGDIEGLPRWVEVALPASREDVRR